MWVYRKILDDKYEVGYIETYHEGEFAYTTFNVVETYRNLASSREAVHYLNGGE